jgi:hypothetical protein
MVQPKLGDVLEPLKDDSNSQTPNPLFMHESNYESVEKEGNCHYYYDSDNECIDMPTEIIVDNDFKDDDEYGLDMFYEKALDDSPLVTILAVAWEDKIEPACDDNLYDDEPTLDEYIDIYAFYDNSYDIWVDKILGKDDSSSDITPIKIDLLYDNDLDDAPVITADPPCVTMVNSKCEVTQNDDLLAGCDDAITHESPVFFLKSPIYTIEDKYAYVEKYLCGSQFSYEKSYCSHDTIKNGTSNYFERGKHDNECHNKFDDPLYLPKISKMHDSNSIFIKFSSSTCNYYERGGYECPLYDTNNYKLHLLICLKRIYNF